MDISGLFSLIAENGLSGIGLMATSVVKKAEYPALELAIA